MKTITVEMARKAVLKGAKPLGTEVLPLGECLGRVPFGDLYSPYDYPLRDVSAMDGYAFRYQDLTIGKSLVLAGERSAGLSAGRGIGKGETVRIMTGAPLPPGADSVVPKERVLVEGKEIRPIDRPSKGSHVRLQGEGMRKGQRIGLPSGPLTDRSLGFLASLGIPSVRVRSLPRVVILVTGSELVPPGKGPGKRYIFESNGLMLRSALKGMGIEAEVQVVPDQPARLDRAVRSSLQAADLLLTTGGVSVGERDWAKESFRKAGIRRIFWRVAQKPGGPLYFGKKGKKAVFGLPGNPAAVYSCFQLYVRPYLSALQGLPLPKVLELSLAHKVKPLGKKTHFMKAAVLGVNGDRLVRALPGQGSHLLASMALGDGLLEVPPGRSPLRKGVRLKFHPFKEVPR